jgi:hypothetical protein
MVPVPRLRQLSATLQIRNVVISLQASCTIACMKVLIVEDELKTGDYLRQGLVEAGFVADLARTGTGRPCTSH